MDVTAQVGIISVFGRGHWLAALLASAKVPVSLLDVSSQMGRWMPEDAEGPFGFFEVQGSQRERLFSESEVRELPQGMTLWLDSGPVEFRGPTTAYRLKRLEVPDSVIQYIQNPESSKNSELLKNLSFRENWLAHFSHAMTSSVETLSPEAVKEGKKRNLFAPFYVREINSQSLEKSLQWCESKGVKVLRNVEVKDLAYREKQVLGSLEIKQDKSGLFKAEQFVFCLTAEEAGMLSHKVQLSLFGDKVKEPEWAWVRYRILWKERQVSSKISKLQIPHHCVVMHDRMLPWSHENLLILRKNQPENQWDVWMRIPNNQRFHGQYLQEKGEAVKTLLEARLPDSQVEITELPRESGSTFQQLGPTRHPVYSRALRTWRKSFQAGNVAFDSPEFWKSLSWDGQFEHQEKIYEILKNWWDRQEELRLKREAKLAAKSKSRGANP